MAEGTKVNQETQTCDLSYAPDALPVKNNPPKTCKEGCQLDGKPNTRNTSYVTCLLCSHNFHCICIGLTEIPVGSWTCPHCRLLPADVTILKSQLSELMTQNAALLEMVTKQQISLNCIQSLESKVTAVHTKMFPDAGDDSDNDEDEPDAEPSGTLLIGDSLLRDVMPTDSNLKVDSTGGAYIVNIKKKLRATNPKRRKYESVILVVGTNDASSKRPAEKISADFKNLITSAKSIATNVTVSSIPPREDNKVDREKLDTIHQMLIPITNEDGVKFINHDINFRYRDDSVDSNLLLADKLHLSTAGVDKLLLNLGLSGKAKARNGNRVTKRSTPVANTMPLPLIPSLMQVHTTPPQSSQFQSNDNSVLFRGAQSPLSNFFPFPLSIWNMNFKSSEHAFQYSKCVQMENKTAAAEVVNSNNALEAKRIGDKIPTTSRWHDTKQGTMYEILKAKSRQCPQFSKALMNSGNRPLVEDTDSHVWGRGANGSGLNLLGRLLTTLRAELSANKYTPHPTVIPPRNHLGMTTPRSHSQQPRCFNCGERSHTMETCGHPPSLRCYGCGGAGHKQKFCRQSRNSH